MHKQIKLSLRIEVVLILLVTLSMALILVYLHEEKLLKNLVISEKIKWIRAPEYGIQDVKIIDKKFWLSEELEKVRKTGISIYEFFKLISQGGGTKISGEGNEKIVNLNIDLDSGEIILVSGDISDADLLVRTNHEIFMLYFILLLILVFVVSYLLISFLIVRPIQRMTGDIEKASTEKSDILPVFIDHSINSKIINELALLNRALVKMSGTIKKRETDINQKMKELSLANEELRNAHESLIRTEKLASIGVLAAGIAHEIGNPIGTLLGFIEILKNEKFTDEEVKKYAKTMEEAAGKIHRIIGDLLSFARTVKEEGQFTGLKDVIENTLKLLAPQKRFKEISVIKFYQEEEILCSISPGKLQQVLLNIFLNAADAMNGKGIIEVKFLKIDNKGIIEIKDYGKGIHQSDLSKIWDPFFTTKPPGEGTGLGLSMSYQIITTYGGDIIVESEEGKGSTFTVKIPVFKDSNNDKEYSHNR